MTLVNETNIQVPTNDYHLKTVIGGSEETLYNFDEILDHSKLHGLADFNTEDLVKFMLKQLYNWNIKLLPPGSECAGISTKKLNKFPNFSFILPSY